jgi:hypothetical protein
VDEKRAAVLRYLEEKKLGRKKEAQAGELELEPDLCSAVRTAWELSSRWSFSRSLWRSFWIFRH